LPLDSPPIPLSGFESTTRKLLKKKKSIFYNNLLDFERFTDFQIDSAGSRARDLEFYFEKRPPLDGLAWGQHVIMTRYVFNTFFSMDERDASGDELMQIYPDWNAYLYTFTTFLIICLVCL